LPQGKYLLQKLPKNFSTLCHSLYSLLLHCIFH
jgi:hypothetical protein